MKKQKIVLCHIDPTDDKKTSGVLEFSSNEDLTRSLKKMRVRSLTLRIGINNNPSKKPGDTFGLEEIKKIGVKSDRVYRPNSDDVPATQTAIEKLPRPASLV